MVQIIDQYRQALGYSGRQLAQASGLERRTVTAVLSGQTLSPGLEVVDAMSRALGIQWEPRHLATLPRLDP